MLYRMKHLKRSAVVIDAQHEIAHDPADKRTAICTPLRKPFSLWAWKPLSLKSRHVRNGEGRTREILINSSIGTPPDQVVKTSESQ